ncbi:MAG: hypothetical protein AAGF84_03765 [Planctomycetota bacterium]
MTEPIRQDIRVNYDGQPVEDATRDLAELQQQNQEAADQTDASAQAAENQSEALNESSREARDNRRAQGDLGEETRKTAREIDRQADAADQAADQLHEQATATDRVSRTSGTAAQNQRELGDSAKEAGAASLPFIGILEDLEAAGGNASAIAGVLAKSLTGIGVAFVGAQGLTELIQGYTRALDANSEAMQRNAALAREQAEARLNLAALQGRESPEDLAFLDQVSAFSGRSQGEVARLQTAVVSQFPNVSEAEQQRLTLEVAALGQTTDAGLTELLGGVGTLYRSTGDARSASNLFLSMVEQGGADQPAQIAAVAAQLIEVGKLVGGLDTGESAGLAAAATGLGIPQDIATTGTRNIVLALRGQGTPQGREILEREGIGFGSDANLIGSLRSISAGLSSGSISPEELESIAGREALTTLATLTTPQNLEQAIEKIQTVDAAEDAPGRVSQQLIESIIGSQAQAANLQAKQLEQAATNTRAQDQNALDAEVARLALDSILAQREAQGRVSPAVSTAIRARFQRRIAAGDDIESALESAAGASSFDTEGTNIRIGPGAILRADLAAQRRDLVDPTLELIERGPQTDPAQILPDNRMDPDDIAAIGAAVGGNLPDSRPGPSYLDAPQNTSSVVEN